MRRPCLPGPWGFCLPRRSAQILAAEYSNPFMALRRTLPGAAWPTRTRRFRVRPCCCAIRCDWTPKRRRWKRRCTAPSAAARSPPTWQFRANRLRHAPLQMRCWLRFSSAFESRGKIGNQVRVIFNAYRDPQQRGADSRPQPRRFFHTGVRHARRVGDETLNAAQGFGQGEALEPGEKRTDGRFAAGEFETQHRTKAALLAARNLVARIAAKTWIVDALHLRLLR